MSTDIKLNQGGGKNWVSVEAAVVELKASDLILESDPQRTSSGVPTAEQRRDKETREWPRELASRNSLS